MAQFLVRDPGKMGLWPDNEKKVSHAPDPDPEKGINTGQAVRTMSFWMMMVFAFLHGFAHGGLYAIVAPITAEYFGTRSHGELFGIVTFVSTFGAAAGPVLAGFVFDATGSYQMVFRILTGVSVAGLICSISLSKRTRERHRRV